MLNELNCLVYIFDIYDIHVDEYFRFQLRQPPLPPSTPIVRLPLGAYAF